MNPDKLFDYLDGKLSPGDRQQVEEKLMSDAQLRREFQIAREIHRSGRDSREVVLPPEDPATVERAGRLGRRIATAAIALIFLNVAGGLAFIGWKQSRPSGERAHEAAVRRQLEQSLGAAGVSALPTPSLSDGQIPLAAPRASWEELASAVVKAAEACGGSGIRDDSESQILITASLPRERANDFARQVRGPNAPTFVPAETDAAMVTIEVRIAESAP